MVSLCVMGWGLVLLENSSVAVIVIVAVTAAAVAAAAGAAAAVAAVAVAAAAVAAAAVAVGCGPKKVGASIKNIGYRHFFKGAFSENTLCTFSRF